MAEFESPVLKAGTSAAGDAVQLVDLSSATKLLVRSDEIQFGVTFGASDEVAGALVCGSRPGEWLVIGERAACDGAVDGVENVGFTNLVDLTHGRALFRLTGTAAPSTLEKVCSLDWSDAMMPDGAVVSASVAKVRCDLIRNDTDGVLSYLIVCDRSFGQYLFDVLLDAAAEFTTRV